MRHLIEHGPAVCSLTVSGHIVADRSVWVNSINGLTAAVPNLQQLHLYGLTDLTMPHLNLSFLQHLTAMTYFHFQRTSQDGPISCFKLSPLAALSSLQDLYLACFDQPITPKGSLSMLCKLTCLDVSIGNTDNDCHVMTFVRSASCLKALDLYGVSGGMPDLSFAPGLQTLELKAVTYPEGAQTGLLSSPHTLTSLTDVELNEVGSMPETVLQHLWHYLEELPSLCRLSLMDANLFALPECTNQSFSSRLKYLCLEHCHLSSIPSGLRGLKALSSLRLHGNMFRGLPYGHYLEQLTYLDIGGNKMAQVPSALALCRHLKYLICNWKVHLPACWETKALKCMLPTECRYERSIPNVTPEVHSCYREMPRSSHDFELGITLRHHY